MYVETFYCYRGVTVLEGWDLCIYCERRTWICWIDYRCPRRAGSKSDGSVHPQPGPARPAGWVTCRSNKCRSPVAPPPAPLPNRLWGGGGLNSYNRVRNWFQAKVCSQNVNFLDAEWLFRQFCDLEMFFMIKRVDGRCTLGRAPQEKARKAPNSHIWGFGQMY